MARGGAYIGGGIPPRILPFMQSGEFRRAFEARRRTMRVMAAIPTFVIVARESGTAGPRRLRPRAGALRRKPHRPALAYLKAHDASQHSACRLQLDHPPARGLRVGRVMRDEQHRQAVFPRLREDQLAHLPAERRVEARERLVEDQRLGARQEACASAPRAPPGRPTASRGRGRRSPRRPDFGERRLDRRAGAPRVPSPPAPRPIRRLPATERCGRSSASWNSRPMPRRSRRQRGHVAAVQRRCGRWRGSRRRGSRR